jgi:hypothetical protein
MRVSVRMPYSSRHKIYLMYLYTQLFASEQYVDFDNISVLVINECGVIVEWGLTRKHVFLKNGNVPGKKKVKLSPCLTN